MERVAGFASQGRESGERRRDAKFLFTAFGAIPAEPPKMEMTKTNNSEQSQLDAYRMRAAMQLGLVAMERAKIFGSSLPLEREELEKLMEKS